MSFFWASFRGIPGEIAVLAGNHDVWARENYSSQELWERFLPKAVENAGMIWLEETVWRCRTVAVVGSLAWYDYSAADPTLPSYRSGFFAALKGEYNMDAEYIDWSWSDREFAAKLGSALCERLLGIETDPGIHDALIITHVPIFEEQMLRKPENFDWGFSNAYFGNLTLGRQILETSKKVKGVISGHTHIGIEAKVRRPGSSEEQSLSVSVLGSDYRMPMCLVIDTDCNAREQWCVKER